MRGRRFILTTSAIVALIARAGHAANGINRLHQTQTVLFEKGQQTVAKGTPTKCTTKSSATKSAAKKSTAKPCIVPVHEPRVPAPPVAPTTSAAATNLPAGIYDSPNACVETSTGVVSGIYDPPNECVEPSIGVVSGGSAPIAESPAISAPS